MTSTDTQAPTADGTVDAVAALAREAERAGHVTLTTGHSADDTVIVRVLTDSERLDVLDLEHVLDAPRRPRGSATLHDPSAFAAYVTRLDEDTTTVWADDQARRIVAVFDDHHTASPGWRQHRAELAVRVDPAWQAWRARDGKLTAQTDFGEFLEDHAPEIVDPPAAVMVDVATTLVARRSLAFESSTRLTSGDVGFVYREETAAKAGGKGTLEIPSQFRVRMAPLVGADPVEVTARLRYRISDGGLQIGYRLHRPDLVEREAFDFVAAVVRAGIPPHVPLLGGTAPAALG